MRRHFFNRRAWRLGLFMPCAPDQQLQQHRCEVDTFLRKSVIYLPLVDFVHLRRNDSCGFQSTQTVRQNVRRDALARVLELFKSSITADHEITNDQ